MRLMLLGTAAIVLSLCCPVRGDTLQAGSSPGVGRLESVAGGGAILRGTNSTDRKAGSPVEESDIVTTERGGIARLVLADGSVILLQERSELRVVRHDPNTQQTLVELLHGRISVIATPVTKSGGGFRIHTPTAVVVAIGTGLDVQTVAKAPPAGTTTTAIHVIDGGKPVAAADVALAVANMGKIPVGKTNETGDATLALLINAGKIAPVGSTSPPRNDALDLANLGKVPLHAEVDRCESGPSSVYLVGPGGDVPHESKGCKRRKLAGVFLWASAQVITLEIGRGTAAVAHVNPQTEPATGASTGPQSLADIPSGVRPGAPGAPAAASLADYGGVSATVVTCRDHFVALSNLDARVAGATYLMPGQSAIVGRAEAPTTVMRFDDKRIVDLLVEETSRSGGNRTAPLRDFGPEGETCEAAWIVDGVQSAGPPAKFDYKVVGMGTSSGNALQVQITNESPCPLYFMVTDGTIMHPKGYTERVVISLALGGVPPLKNFQKMITMGGLVRVPGAKSGADVKVTMMLRSYCVELHKLAPHQKTEYTFAYGDDQRDLGPNYTIVDRAVRLVQTSQVTLTPSHGLDSVIQWSLWARIEKLDEKKFLDEFTKLVHKNYDAQKKKWDKAAEKDVDTSGRQLFKLVSTVLG